MNNSCKYVSNYSIKIIKKKLKIGQIYKNVTNLTVKRGLTIASDSAIQYKYGNKEKRSAEIRFWKFSERKLLHVTKAKERTKFYGEACHVHRR